MPRGMPKSGVTSDRLDQWNANRVTDASKRGHRSPKRLVAVSAEFTTWRRSSTSTGASSRIALARRRTPRSSLNNWEIFATRQCRSSAIAFRARPRDRHLGQLRNQITLYQSTSQKKEFFPRIEFLRVSLGHSYAGEVSGHGQLITGVTLAAGQRLDFEAQAWMPKTPRWPGCLASESRRTTGRSPRAGESPSHGRLTPSDIGELVGVRVCMRAEATITDRMTSMTAQASSMTSFRAARCTTDEIGLDVADTSVASPWSAS